LNYTITDSADDRHRITLRLSTVGSRIIGWTLLILSLPGLPAGLFLAFFDTFQTGALVAGFSGLLLFASRMMLSGPPVPRFLIFDRTEKALLAAESRRGPFTLLAGYEECGRFDIGTLRDENIRYHSVELSLKRGAVLSLYRTRSRQKAESWLASLSALVDMSDHGIPSVRKTGPDDSWFSRTGTSSSSVQLAWDPPRTVANGPAGAGFLFSLALIIAGISVRFSVVLRILLLLPVLMVVILSFLDRMSRGKKRYRLSVDRNGLTFDGRWSLLLKPIRFHIPASQFRNISCDWNGSEADFSLYFTDDQENDRLHDIRRGRTSLTGIPDDIHLLRSLQRIPLSGFQLSKTLSLRRIIIRTLTEGHA
jgi:hypothetical protein